jgi:alpha-amylase
LNICFKDRRVDWYLVFGAEVEPAASYQKVLDSVLNYPIYDALIQAFSIPGPSNMSGLAQVHKLAKTAFKDTTLLGNFLENHDNPRWANLSVDPQSM